jgi:hypothetical protein
LWLWSVAVFAAPSTISFSTYLGGSNDDDVRDVATDALGNIYLTGTVGSMNFPGLDAASLTNAGAGLRYVAKLDGNGRALQYVTVVGGGYADLHNDVTRGLQNGDRVEGLAVDSSGTAYVVAYASSTTFPATGGTYQRSGGKNLYKIDPAGQIVATFPLDPAIRSVRALALDRSNQIYLAGTAAPGLRTTTGVVYPTSAAIGPCLVKIDAASGNVAYATYLSQAGQRAFTVTTLPPFDRQTTPLAMAVDDTGRVHLTGQATSHFAPTPGAVDRGDHEHLQTFVAKLNPVATAFEFVARIGAHDSDRGTGIAVAPDGGIVVVGKTLDQTFPTVYAFQTAVPYQVGTSGVYEIGYVVRLTADGTAITASSQISAGSGNLTDYGADTVEPGPLRVALDPFGNIWIAGTTAPPRIVPTLDPLQSTSGGASEALVLKLQPDARRLLFSTTLGGAADDLALALTATPTGDIIVAGRTSSADYPAVNALQGGVGSPSKSFQSNAFITRLSAGAKPVDLAVSANPATAGQGLDLVARAASADEAGIVEFRTGAIVLGSAKVLGGTARLTVLLSPGVHALSARYRGPGLFDGYTSPVLYQVVNPACL